MPKTAGLGMTKRELEKFDELIEVIEDHKEMLERHQNALISQHGLITATRKELREQLVGKRRAAAKAA